MDFISVQKAYTEQVQDTRLRKRRRRGCRVSGELDVKSMKITNWSQISADREKLATLRWWESYNGKPEEKFVCLAGCAILGVGIWLRVDESAAEFMGKSSKLDIIYTLAYVLMAIGFLIMLIGFLGCCGAVRESQCMLATFFLLLFIIFAILLGFGIWAAVAKDSFKDYTQDMLKEGVDKYHEDKKQAAFMDSVQIFFKCCGHTLGNLDYDRVKTVPQSCHPDNYAKPCRHAFYQWIESRLNVIAGVAIGFAIKMLLGMIFSMLLCCAIRDQVA